LKATGDLSLTSDTGPQTNGSVIQIFPERRAVSWRLRRLLRRRPADADDWRIGRANSRWPRPAISPGAAWESAYGTDIALIQSPTNIDGISILPTLVHIQTNRHKVVLWKLQSRYEPTVRMGDWKAVQQRPVRRGALQPQNGSGRNEQRRR